MTLIYDTDILRVLQQGNSLNILERFYDYKTAKYKPLMNEHFVMDFNVQFDLVVDTRRSEVIAGTLVPLITNITINTQGTCTIRPVPKERHTVWSTVAPAWYVTVQ
jgi:hypothetical protein